MSHVCFETSGAKEAMHGVLLAVLEKGIWRVRHVAFGSEEQVSHDITEHQQLYNMSVVGYIKTEPEGPPVLTEEDKQKLIALAQGVVSSVFVIVSYDKDIEGTITILSCPSASDTPDATPVPQECQMPMLTRRLAGEHFAWINHGAHIV